MHELYKNSAQQSMGVPKSRASTLVLTSSQLMLSLLLVTAWESSKHSQWWILCIHSMYVLFTIVRAQQHQHDVVIIIKSLCHQQWQCVLSMMSPAATAANAIVTGITLEK